MGMHKLVDLLDKYFTYEYMEILRREKYVLW